MGDRELRASILANPDDDATFLVYADALLERGEPRGELIALDAAIARAPIGARAALRSRRAELLRSPALAPPPQRGTTLRWHLGFVRAVIVEHDVDLAQLFAHAARAFAVSLELQNESNLAAAAKLDLPRTVRSLAFDPPSWSRRGSPIDVDAVAAAYPHVTRIAATRPVALTAAPQLRALEVRGVESEAIATIAAASLPALDTLVLQLRSTWPRTPPAAIAAAELGPLLERPPPRLAHLEIVNPPPGDELIALIATSPLLRGLRTLTMWNAGLSAAGSRVVTRERGHLERLDLTDVGHDAETVALLRGVCREVRLGSELSLVRAGHPTPPGPRA